MESMHLLHMFIYNASLILKVKTAAEYAFVFQTMTITKAVGQGKSQIGIGSENKLK